MKKKKLKCSHCGTESADKWYNVECCLECFNKGKERITDWRNDEW